MKRPILALIPSAYKKGVIFSKVYSILPVNGDGDFDLIRSSYGTRVQENGLIENKTNNVPRLDWLNSDCPSLLLEPQRTNYAIYSNDASQWTNIGGSQSITKTQNYSIAPNGEQTATRLQATATGSGYSLIQLSTSSFTGNYSGSVYLKSNTGNTQNVIVYGRNTPVNSYPIGNEWQRIEIQGSGISGQNLYLFLGSFPNNGSDESIDVSVWGGQLEQGVYSTSLIYTEGSSVTRSEDWYVRTILSGQTQFDKNKGVVFIDVNPFEFNVAQTSSISLQDGAYSMLSFNFKQNNILEFFINNAPAPGAVSYDYSHSGGRIKAAIGWSNGSYRLFANGQLLNSYSTSIEFYQLDRFEFNSYFGTNDFFGKIYSVQVFDELLSDAEIKNMTEL